MSFASLKSLVAVTLGAALLGCAPSESRVMRLEWPEMGTIAALSFRGVSASERTHLVEEVRTLYQNLAHKLNAWDADSELGRLTTTNAWQSRVSPDVRPCYAAAFRLMAESQGAFNPMLASTLRAHGLTRRAALLDLGGIAKGFAVDRAYEHITAVRADAANILIDLGGNLRACGGEWRVGVRNPLDGSLCARVLLRDGEALATSGTYERGRHILDGRTGETAESGVASVTVLAPTAMVADGLSTTLFVLGERLGRQFLAAHYPLVEAFFVRPDGTAVSVGPGNRFVTGSGLTSD